MLYTLYELQRASTLPLRWGAKAQLQTWAAPWNPLRGTEFARTATASASLIERATRSYTKPKWPFASTMINGVEVPVEPVAVMSEPWFRLLHFKRSAPDFARAVGPKGRVDPRVLIIAPLSGHYATLLADTVAGFLPNHEVFIADWSDARMVPLVMGRFDLNDYIDAVISMMAAVGPGANVVAVCQPGPAVLSATALMAESEDPALPANIAIMGSPIDARRSPTQPNKLAEERPLDWFRSNMIFTVPLNYPGAMRRVYPGFVQLASFMNMNWDRHVDAHKTFFEHLVNGDGESAQKHRAFYDEYLAVLDLPEEFYLQTIEDVFQKHKLPRGEFYHRGRLVKPEAIRTVGLVTVQGERDDISGIGQTQAAHDLCVNIPANRKIDYTQPGVGHYGVFSGRRYRTEIYPVMREFFKSGFSPKKEREQRALSSLATPIFGEGA